MFNMMNQFMLLARGKIIYFNEASKAVDYFSNIGYRCPELQNPSDYFMQIISIESIEQEREDEMGQSLREGDTAPLRTKTVIEEYKERIDYFSRQYNSSPLSNDAGSCECNDEYEPISTQLLQAAASSASWWY